MFPIEQNGIRYQLLDKDHLDETVDIVTSHFIAEEYLTRESKLSYAEFSPLVRAYCELDLTQKLSIIAVDINTGKVIGFSICEDPKLPNAVNANEFLPLTPNYKPFFAVLEELHHHCLKKQFEIGECFHLFLLGVLPGYQGKKIGKTLVKLSGDYAKSKDFKYVLIEATSPKTKPICESMGYENLGNIVYKDFTLNNKKPFSHLTDYDGPYMFLLSLPLLIAAVNLSIETMQAYHQTLSVASVPRGPSSPALHRLPQGEMQSANAGNSKVTEVATNGRAEMKYD